MRKASLLVSCLVVAGAACSDGSSSSGPTSTSPPASTSSTAAPGKPSASIRLTGDAELTGNVTEPSVRCNFPVLEGLSIAVLGQAHDETFQARIGVQAGKVTVHVSSGTDTEYHERAFEGTGVTSFDAARGAAVDSTLTETAAATGSTKGDVGAITAIKGSVDCGEQTPGTSTVAITGVTAEGALDAARLDPVRVECDETPDGDEIFASGLVQVGASRALIGIGLASDGTVGVTVSLRSGVHRYSADGTSRITSTGGQVRADAVEKSAAPPAATLHVEGDLSCGLNAAG